VQCGSPHDGGRRLQKNGLALVHGRRVATPNIY
jgi:hypothetical protein